MAVQRRPTAPRVRERRRRRPFERLAPTQDHCSLIVPCPTRFMRMCLKARCRAKSQTAPTLRGSLFLPLCHQIHHPPRISACAAIRHPLSLVSTTHLSHLSTPRHTDTPHLLPRPPNPDHAAPRVRPRWRLARQSTASACRSSASGCFENLNVSFIRFLEAIAIAFVLHRRHARASFLRCCIVM